MSAVPCEIKAARPQDIPIILRFIRELAEYEKLLHEVEASEEKLLQSLFGTRPECESVIAWVGSEPVGHALFFHNFSTFMSRKGLYLEDLYVTPNHRGHGYGRALILHLARLAVERGCGRFEWVVLDWNRSAIEFYRELGAVIQPEWQICRLTGDALDRLAANPSPTGSTSPI